MKIRRLTKSRFVLFAALLLFAVTTSGWFFTGYLTELATRTVKKNVADANLIISLHLINELKRIEGAAVAVAGSPLTLPVLQARTPENVDKANNILDRYHKSLDASACYLIDRSGITITSSNRNAEDSFVGQNYTFRPYFQQAIKSGVGRHFALGTVSGRRGFFASAPVRDKEGRIIGVVTIKKELDDIETKLNQYIWFLVDRNGIIFLSSLPEARLKSLWPLENATQKQIVATKQFGPGPFDPVLQKQITAGEEVAFKGNKYVAAQHGTPYDGISVVLLWPMQDVDMYRYFGIALTILSDLIAIGFFLVVYIFRRSLREREHAAQDLKSYADQLKTGAELKSHISRISAEMQKTDTLEELAQTFMYHLAPLTGIVYGAFYILDEQEALLKPIGGYGRMEGKEGDRTFAVGQGLVGQCAQEKAPIEITDPQHITIRINWGGGDLCPREILLLAVLQLERVLGVIELAALTPFTEEQRALIAQLVSVVALNIEILQRNIKTRELLEQSRYQAEALAASEQQLLVRQGELEEQKELLLAQHHELEQSQEMMMKAEERSRTILNAISVGTMIIHPKTKIIVDVNPVGAGIIGLPREDIIGKTCHKFVCPREERQCPITDLGQKIDNSECIMLNAAGKEIPVIKTVTSVMLGDEELLLESFVDITERKEIEKKLLEFNEQIRVLSNVVEQSPLSVMITDRQGLIEYVNPKFASLTGYDAKEIRGSNPRVLKSGQHDQHFYADLWETILSGREWHGEICNRKKGGELYWERASISSIRSQTGNITHFVSIREDFTEQMRMEAKLKEHMEELERFNKLTIKREGKMIFLKEEINALLLQMGREAKYKIVE
jgi:PAS domain S-box-containing protein